MTELLERALYLSVSLALPVLVVALVIGLLVAVFSAAFQVQDQTLSHLPRLLAVAAVLVMMGPSMGRQVSRYASELFSKEIARPHP